MISMDKKIQDTQKTLALLQLDGWLLYDFRRNNDLACQFLDIPSDRLLSRRFFYWIPQKGDPVKIVHTIESNVLDHLPGCKLPYHTWQEIETHLAEILKKSKRIAMEYSPRNAIPAVSKVDAGTLDIIRDFGIEVVSSGDILQQYTSIWDDYKLKTHLAAARILDETVAKAWQYISDHLRQKKPLTEYQVQQYIIGEFLKRGCVASDPPICAVNAHSADPHYCPDKLHSSIIQEGDFILIDLWCKQNVPRAVYADITRVGVAFSHPTDRQQMIFDIVKNARDAGTELVRDRFLQKKPVLGCEVDQCCRDVISSAGYGRYFIHRTGHNIDESDHGNGAHLDNLETQDSRQLLAGTCFSIEPGIYLPGEFGVRLEYDVYVSPEGDVHVTGGIQNEILCLLS